jgi:hypothetical protein
MAKPFTSAQRRQNAAFLAALARTGNARMSAREVGVKYSTMQHRRPGHPDFASRWDIASVEAHVRFQAAGGKGLGLVEQSRTGALRQAQDERKWGSLRTEGGELMVVRTRSGRLQVRPAHRGKLTRAAEQLFLQALSATANIRLSAAAVGASARAFHRRRERNPAFARERRLALEMGYVRLEMAALMAAAPESHADDAWRENDPPPIPPMTPEQAIHLLYLHEKSVREGWELPHRRRRRGESEETYRLRLAAMWAAEQRRAREDEAVREAIELDEREPPPELPPLPALDQVTGWSKASGKPPYHAGVALFGGWRIEDIPASRRSDGRRRGGPT